MRTLRSLVVGRLRVPGGERGSMAIEVVLLVPVVVAVMLLVIGAGRFVDRQGDVDAAAREGARAASYERDLGSARVAARNAAHQALPGDLDCRLASVDGREFYAGGAVHVRVDCRVDLSELGFIGFPGSVSLSGSSSAPLDQWRRTS